jgi:hypothetical protein
MNVEMRPIGSILPYEHNNKLHPQSQIDKIARSIKEFGFNVPILVDEHNVIIAGHGRLLAAKQLGLQNVPTVTLTDLTPAQILQYRIADNKSAESEWDIEALKYEFGELQKLDLDMTATGFSMDEINNILGVETEEIEADDPDTITTDIQVGDVFQIGSHRLMCGDSIQYDDVAGLMDGKLSDMIHTDPPYNVDYGSSKKQKVRSIENDNLDTSSWEHFCRDLFQNFQAFNKGDIYMWGAPGPEGMRMRLWLTEMGCHWSATIIWKKDRLVLSQANYQRMYEPCFYGWFKKSTYDAGRKEVEVWDLKRPTSSKLHPTMKPVELCARARLQILAENVILSSICLADQAAQWSPANNLVGCVT